MGVMLYVTYVEKTTMPMNVQRNSLTLVIKNPTVIQIQVPAQGRKIDNMNQPKMKRNLTTMTKARDQSQTHINTLLLKPSPTPTTTLTKTLATTALCL